MRYIFSLLCLLALPLAGLWGQIIGPGVDFADSTQSHVLILKDGQTLYGRALGFKGKALIFRSTLNGELRIALTDIESLDRADAPDLPIPGEALPASVWDSGPSNLITSATAFGRPAGTREVHNLGLAYTRFDYALSDNLRIGINTVPPFFFGGQIQLSGEVLPGLHLGYQGRAFFTPFSIWLSSTFDIPEALPALNFHQHSALMSIGTPEGFFNASISYFSNFNNSFEATIFSVGQAKQIGRYAILGELSVIGVEDRWLPGILVGPRYRMGKHNVGAYGGLSLWSFDDFPLFPIASFDYSYRF